MEDIGFLIKRVVTGIRNLADANFGSFDLTFSQAHILHCLDSHGGSMSQKEIEKAIHLAHPTVVGLIERLKENGYVEYRTDENDRRIKIVSMTDKIKEVDVEIRARKDQEDEYIYGCLSDDEKEMLISCLKKIADRIENVKGEEHV